LYFINVAFNYTNNFLLNASVSTLFLLIVCFFFTKRNLGCWKDTAVRAVATLEGSVAILDGLDYTNRADAIKKCYEAAKLRGFNVFAVQNGGWCAAGNGESYKKYGASNDCKDDGKGGPWANQVYKIHEKLAYK
jgi:hypothetical protein